MLLEQEISMFAAMCQNAKKKLLQLTTSALRCNVFFLQRSFSQQSLFEELSQSLHICMLVLKSILPWDVHNNGRHDNTIKANETQPTPWVGARMRRTQMRRNQQLSQALIHRLTRIHPPVKPAGKASTTHMYTSKTYLTWPDLTVGRDVITPPPPPTPRKNLARQTTSTTSETCLT